MSGKNVRLIAIFQSWLFKDRATYHGQCFWSFVKLYKASSFLPWAPYLPLLLCSLGTQEFGQKGSTDARKTQKYANGQICKYTKKQIHKRENEKSWQIRGDKDTRQTHKHLQIHKNYRHEKEAKLIHQYSFLKYFSKYVPNYFIKIGFDTTSNKIYL